MITTRKKILRKVESKKTLIADAEILKRRQAEIAEVAFALFLHQGYHTTSVREIAERAGVSVGALFTYFAGKEDILFYILDHGLSTIGRGLEEVKNEALELIARGAPREQVLAKVVAGYCRVIEETRQFTLLAYQETKSLVESARRMLFDKERQTVAVFEMALRYAAPAELWSEHETWLLAHSIVMLCETWALRGWFLREQVNSVEEYAAHVARIALGALKSSRPDAISAIASDSAQPRPGTAAR